jgi:NAD(P)-dependent dehydrogenase (short-subunit alcohol dehydrogenase family)
MSNTNRIVLITGASRGLGRNAAIAAARRGCDIIATYHTRRAEADAVVAEIQGLGRKAIALQLDTGDAASFPAFAAALRAALAATWQTDRLYGLVNNAGIGILKPFGEFPEADFDALVNIHFKGVFFLTQALVPLIVDGGRIVNLSSGLARMTSRSGAMVYGALKSAVETLTRYLAKELGPRRITVNALAPGAIATDFAGGFVRDDREANAATAAQIAMGRVGEPDDIGPVIAALLSGDFGWVTGQRIEASGGQNL